jgi:hypothetical protein
MVARNGHSLACSDVLETMLGAKPCVNTKGLV